MTRSPHQATGVTTAPASTTSTSASNDRYDHEQRLLHYLAEHETIAELQQWLHQQQLDAQLYDLYINIAKSLASEKYIHLTTEDIEHWKLTAEGETYRTQHTPEYQLYTAIKAAKSLPRDDAEKQLGKEVVTIGQTQAIIQKWITFDKPSKSFQLNTAVTDVQDTVQQQLQQIHDGQSLTDAKQYDLLKKRKMASKQILKRYSLQRGTDFSTQRKKVATDLTPEMLRNNEWQNVQFKEYNFDTLGTDLKPGTLHPLLKVRSEIRQVLLGMGFTEMPTDQYVESSFWNFDALYQPQQHPARDAHDTFFIAHPAQTVTLPESYVEKVKAAHENGGDTGSIGYRYDWKMEEATKNILRTHTTAVSTRMLYKLAHAKPFRAVKWFSIDRVFRNETLDATHLAEFHQVEGVVADVGLTLGDLMGTIETFFRRIGITDMRFKPAYNPYTEPSMEIFGYSPQLGKWLEIGNSGMFRPEMLETMGLPPDVTVIAWGLSLERPTMIKYGIRNIRDLFGHKVRLDIIRKNPIARYDAFLPEDDQSHTLPHQHSKDEPISGGPGQYRH